MELTEPFKLNQEGFALLQKFIFLRMKKDLEWELEEIELLKDKLKSAGQKEGFFNSIGKFQTEHSLTKALERLEKKEAWQRDWMNDNLSSLPAYLNDVSVQELISWHSRTAIGRIQLFLILQEVVHTPIYYAHDSIKAAGDEKHFEKILSEFSQLCGLENISNKILSDTKSFFKDIKRENTNILKWGIYGLVGVSTLAAILAMPVIAPAIGGLMGLSGAAATASGLALLGGGSIAAGGLGMAGGMTVLVGGSGILGAVAGGAAGKLLGQLPQEAIALNVIKVVNLINFLKSNNRDLSTTDDIQKTAILLFLKFKEATEKELVFNGIQKDKKESLKLLDILNVGLKRII